MTLFKFSHVGLSLRPLDLSLTARLDALTDLRGSGLASLAASGRYPFVINQVQLILRRRPEQPDHRVVDLVASPLGLGGQVIH